MGYGTRTGRSCTSYKTSAWNTHLNTKVWNLFFYGIWHVLRRVALGWCCGFKWEGRGNMYVRNPSIGQFHFCSLPPFYFSFFLSPPSFSFFVVTLFILRHRINVGPDPYRKGSVPGTRQNPDIITQGVPVQLSRPSVGQYVLRLLLNHDARCRRY